MTVVENANNSSMVSGEESSVESLVGNKTDVLLFWFRICNILDLML